MRLTLFGETSRQLRMKYDLTLKSMASAMGISSAYLSALEFGDKPLLQKHIDSAIAFFDGKATAQQVADLRAAAESSQKTVSTTDLNSDQRRWVATLARRLQSGEAPPPDMLDWLNNNLKGQQ